MMKSVRSPEPHACSATMQTTEPETVLRPTPRGISSRTDQVAKQLTGLILDGHLKQGKLLPPERDLAVQLGVSRTVVREATKILQSDGLVSIRHGAGTLVTGATSEPVQRVFTQALHGESDALPKLYQVRCALETEIITIAAAHRTSVDLENLRALCREMDKNLSLPEEQRERLWELDMAFHSALAQATQNSIFVVVLEAATKLLIPMRKRSTRVGRSNEVAQKEHWQLLEFVEARDAASARKLMRTHLEMFLEE